MNVETQSAVVKSHEWFIIKTTILTAKAPSRMPGALRYPSNNMAAKAMPEGGQTGVALEFSKANSNPTLADIKYTPAIARIIKRLLMDFKVCVDF